MKKNIKNPKNKKNDLQNDIKKLINDLLPVDNMEEAARIINDYRIEKTAQGQLDSTYGLGRVLKKLEELKDIDTVHSFSKFAKQNNKLDLDKAYEVFEIDGFKDEPKPKKKIEKNIITPTISLEDVKAEEIRKMSLRTDNDEVQDEIKEFITDFDFTGQDIKKRIVDFIEGKTEVQKYAHLRAFDVIDTKDGQKMITKGVIHAKKGMNRGAKIDKELRKNILVETGDAKVLLKIADTFDPDLFDDFVAFLRDNDSLRVTTAYDFFTKQSGIKKRLAEVKKLREEDEDEGVKEYEEFSIPKIFYGKEYASILKDIKKREIKNEAIFSDVKKFREMGEIPEYEEIKIASFGKPELYNKYIIESDGVKKFIYTLDGMNANDRNNSIEQYNNLQQYMNPSIRNALLQIKKLDDSLFKDFINVLKNDKRSLPVVYIYFKKSILREPLKKSDEEYIKFISELRYKNMPIKTYDDFKYGDKFEEKLRKIELKLEKQRELASIQLRGKSIDKELEKMLVDEIDVLKNDIALLDQINNFNPVEKEVEKEVKILVPNLLDLIMNDIKTNYDSAFNLDKDENKSFAINPDEIDLSEPSDRYLTDDEVDERIKSRAIEIESEKNMSTKISLEDDVVFEEEEFQKCSNAKCSKPITVKTIYHDKKEKYPTKILCLDCLEKSNKFEIDA